MATNNSANYNPTQYNVQTGGASGTLNNVAPSATSGVPVISQGSSSQPTFGTMVVGGGGTGVTSTTTYTPICGGTSSTAAFQSVASLGNTGDVLTSNGASALPTFQAPTAVKRDVFTLSTSFTIADGVTLYFNNYAAESSSLSSANTRLIMPISGTINIVYGLFRVGGTLASSENLTVALRKNDTTDSNVTTTLQLSSASNAFNTTSLGLSVAAGDFIHVKVVCPTFATDPTSVVGAVSFIVS